MKIVIHREDAEGKIIKIAYESEFDLGDAVFHKADPDGTLGQVQDIILTPNGVVYRCMFGFEMDEYYDIQLTKNIAAKD